MEEDFGTRGTGATATATEHPAVPEAALEVPVRRHDEREE